MMKYFSADWLAQSYDNTARTEEHGAGMDTAPTYRPHIPCMVQPSPPTFAKGYLQLKPKPSKVVKHMEPEERDTPWDRSLCSPLHSARCASPKICRYSSRYDSETALDEGSEVEKDGSQRRTRTKFTPEQISKLEKIFNKNKYLDAGEKVNMAQKLTLTETQVGTWFQNRRMKLKREMPVTLSPVQYRTHGPHCAATGRTFYPLAICHLMSHHPYFY
ncbi:homeobox protein pv.1-like [Brachyistius frenatus]|uniref:homeobox protein pv.1-like n=1 Tax=Brachyistius frenatus TaxID=100188 RepID=UPI0037E89C64